MKEPGQNCKYVNDLENEFLKYIPEEARAELKQMCQIIKDRFTLMRKYANSKDSTNESV